MDGIGINKRAVPGSAAIQAVPNIALSRSTRTALKGCKSKRFKDAIAMLLAATNIIRYAFFDQQTGKPWQIRLNNELENFRRGGKALLRTSLP